jgi:hypothetical protein
LSPLLGPLSFQLPFFWGVSFTLIHHLLEVLLMYLSQFATYV